MKQDSRIKNEVTNVVQASILHYYHRYCRLEILLWRTCIEVILKVSICFYMYSKMSISFKEECIDHDRLSPHVISLIITVLTECHPLPECTVKYVEAFHTFSKQTGARWTTALNDQVRYCDVPRTQERHIIIMAWLGVGKGSTANNCTAWPNGCDEHICSVSHLRLPG